MNFIPIYKPYLKKYKKSAIDAIESEWISNHGRYVTLANDKLKDILKVKYSILMANGTCATICLFASLKYKYPDIKTIYIPNNVYVACYNSALFCYSESSLKILKINSDTWNQRIDKEYLLSLEKDSAILVVHNLGNIVDVDYIKSIRPDLIILEDNCEGIFGKYSSGKFSSSSENILCSAVSFYGNKSITTGEGGAFFTNDEEIYKYIQGYYSQGMSEKKFIHNIQAYNFRMTNVEAAFLYDQLNDIDHILELKNKIFKNYEILFEPLIKKNKITLQVKEKESLKATWIFAIRIPGKSYIEINKYLSENGIDSRPFFYPVNYHNHLKNIKFEDENSILLSDEIVMLPSYPELTYEEQQYIVKIISNYLE